MKKLISLLCVVLASFLSSGAHAEPKSITTISAEQVSELEIMHQRATDLLLKNDFQGALRAYSDIVLVEPDDETAYTGLGQIYMVLGQLKKAHEAFENALQINPNNEVALLGIRKIMDPDGVEGMTNRQAPEENNETHPSSNVISQERPPIDVAYAPLARIEKRFGPFSPIPKKIQSVKKPLGKEFRLGKLNAQRIQMSLKNAGVYAGPLNGLLGRKTRRGIRAFQKVRGILETGKIDSATRGTLLPYLAYNANEFDPARKLRG